MLRSTRTLLALAATIWTASIFAPALREEDAVLVALALLAALVGMRRAVPHRRAGSWAMVCVALAAVFAALPVDERARAMLARGVVAEVEPVAFGWRLVLDDGRRLLVRRTGDPHLDAFPQGFGLGARVRWRAEPPLPAPVSLRVVEAARRTQITRSLARARASLHERSLERFLADEEARDTGALLVAMTVGRRSAVGAELRRDLEDAGLVHLAVVSGLHVGALALFAARIGTPFAGRRRGARRVLAVVAASAIALVVPAAPPVARAALAVLVAHAAAGAGRGVPAPAALALAAAALLVGDPGLGRSWSFALTVAASLALALSGSRARGIRLGRAVDVALAPCLAVWPLLVLMTGRCSPWTPLANACAAPAALPALVTGWLALALPEGVARPALELAHACAGVILGVARHVASWPGSGWLAREVGPVWAGLQLAVTGVWLVRRPGAGRHAALVAAVALSAWPMVRPPLDPERAGVHLVDVGQGQAVVVSDGRGACLVDAADDRDPRGTRQLLAWLRRTRTQRLDALVVTHLDRDHSGGAHAVLRACDVGRLVLPPGGAASAEASRFVAEAHRRGVAVRTVSRGDVIRCGARTLRVVHPRAGSFDTDNEGSIVLVGSVAGVRVMLPGDAGVRTEAAFLELGDRGPVDVLVAGHHGARTSTSRTLLDALNPRLVLVSAGAGTRFGHPHPEVVDRARDAGARVAITSRRGTLSVRVVRGRLVVSAFEDVQRDGREGREEEHERDDREDDARRAERLRVVR